MRVVGLSREGCQVILLLTALSSGWGQEVRLPEGFPDPLRTLQTKGPSRLLQIKACSVEEWKIQNTSCANLCTLTNLDKLLASPAGHW